MDSLGTTSGGLFARGYETHSTLRAWTEPWSAWRTGAKASFYGEILDPTGQCYAFMSHAYDADALKRVIACFIIASLPREGMTEAFDSLKGMLDYYGTRVQFTPTPAPRLLQGTVLNKSQRPELVLSGGE